MRSIYLCGFMGCGKTTVGKILAKKLECKFIDLDQFIESNEKMSIAEIFDKKGEEHFRELEHMALKELSEESCVVATGGGALLSEKNSQLLKGRAISCYIDTEFKKCYSRIKGDKRRPIAYSSTENQLLERFMHRKPIYEKHSDFSVDGDFSPEEIALSIIEKL